MMTTTTAQDRARQVEAIRERMPAIDAHAAVNACRGRLEALQRWSTENPSAPADDREANTAAIDTAKADLRHALAALAPYDTGA